ncbi:MAG: redoxin domain-containing protein, partial [Chloroflexi bacterium]|nr:redoxin domain-containing protein [Chloroflexota bacterium]
MRRALLLLATLALLAAACSESIPQLETPLDESDEDSYVAISDTLPEAPEFPGGHTWFNVGSPLTIEALRGKVVLLDFWTSGCINCQQIVPDLTRLEEEYGDAFVVIGVHSGKYDREHEDSSVLQALQR